MSRRFGQDCPVLFQGTFESCPKRRDKENSCAGAEGELKDSPNELSTICWVDYYNTTVLCITTPAKKKRTILVMHHVISKNLRSDFAAMHRCVKSRQSQVAFTRGSAAESSSMIPRYHKILILCIKGMVLFFFFLSRVVVCTKNLKNSSRQKLTTDVRFEELKEQLVGSELKQNGSHELASN